MKEEENNSRDSTPGVMTASLYQITSHILSIVSNWKSKALEKIAGERRNARVTVYIHNLIKESSEFRYGKQDWVSLLI